MNHTILMSMSIDQPFFHNPEIVPTVCSGIAACLSQTLACFDSSVVKREEKSVECDKHSILQQMMVRVANFKLDYCLIGRRGVSCACWGCGYGQ